MQRLGLCALRLGAQRRGFAQARHLCAMAENLEVVGRSKYFRYYRQTTFGEHEEPPSAALSGGAGEGAATAAKTPKDSEVTVHLPFSKDKALRLQYRSFRGSYRLGRFLEDFDAIAADVGFRHAAVADADFALVTASVDRIRVSRDLSNLRAGTDVEFQGLPLSVGRSSMEVKVRLREAGTEKWLCEAIFVMVARNTETNASVALNPLDLSGEDDEERLHREAAERKAGRLQRASTINDEDAMPTDEEFHHIHRLFLESEHGTDHEHYTGIRSTVLRDLEIMHPEHRNAHARIFGGYLMRETYELAHVCASQFSGGTIHPVVFSDFSFLAPVNIGSVISMTAQVVFTTKRHLQVQVDVSKLPGPNGDAVITDRMHVLFEIDDGAPELSKAVLPETYPEALLYLKGRSRYLQAVEDGDVAPS